MVHEISTHNTSRDSEVSHKKKLRTEEPVEEPEETREELKQRLKEIIRRDDEEKEEDERQKEHEESRRKQHWTQRRKKPGRRRTEEDEGLFLRFPDGKVSCASNHVQCVLIFLFSVSVVSRKSQASSCLEIQTTPPTCPSQGRRYCTVSMARMQLCKDIHYLRFINFAHSFCTEDCRYIQYGSSCEGT